MCSQTLSLAYVEEEEKADFQCSNNIQTMFYQQPLLREVGSTFHECHTISPVLRSPVPECPRSPNVPESWSLKCPLSGGAALVPWVSAV